MVYRYKIITISSIFWIFISFTILPVPGADYPAEYPPNSISDYMIDESTIMTVVNDIDLDIEFIILYRNPYDEYKNLTCRFDIPWIFSHGNCRLFGVNGSKWLDVPPDTAYVAYWRNVSAFESFIEILKGTHFGAIEKRGNIYSISHEFLGYDFPFHKVELRIPLVKNQTKVNLMNINPIPLTKTEESNFYIITWKWDGTTKPYNQTSALFHVEYVYEPLPFFETPLGKLLLHPLFLLIVGWFLGLITLDVILKFVKRKKRSGTKTGTKKVSINKGKLEQFLKFCIIGLIPLLGVFLVPFILYNLVELLYAFLISLILLIVISLLYVVDYTEGKPKIDWKKVPDLIHAGRYKKRRK